MGDHESGSPDPARSARTAGSSDDGRPPETASSSGPERERPPGTDAETLSVTREELRTTFQYQVERLREIDSKAIEILKANLLLIGIVVTGGSVLTQTDLDIALFINPFTVAGVLLLLISTGVASVTYTSSNLRGGIGSTAVEAAIAERRKTALPSPPDGDVGAAAETASETTTETASETTTGIAAETTFEERLVRSYARWIDYNARMTAVNDILVTVTVLTVFVAFVYVAVGVAVAALGVTPLVSWGVFAVITGLAGAFVRITYHMDHLGTTEERHGETFRGIKLSKGTTRSRGLRTLREMVGWFSSTEEDEGK